MIQQLKYFYELDGVRGIKNAVASKFFGARPVVDIRDDPQWPPVTLRFGTSDLHTFGQVFSDGEYEFETRRPPTTIIDAGANIGLAAVVFARRFPSATIVAVEPERQNFEQLQRNVSHYPNVHPVHAAVWSEEGEIVLQDEGLGEWGFTTRAVSADGSGTTVATVPATTVHALMDRFDLDTVDFLKIDIEGAEVEVLGTSDSWIDRVDSLAIELHERMKPGCVAAFETATEAFPVHWRRGENYFCTRDNGVVIEPDSFCPTTPVV